MAALIDDSIGRWEIQISSMAKQIFLDNLGGNRDIIVSVLVEWYLRVFKAEKNNATLKLTNVAKLSFRTLHFYACYALKITHSNSHIWLSARFDKFRNKVTLQRLDKLRTVLPQIIVSQVRGVQVISAALLSGSILQALLGSSKQCLLSQTFPDQSFFERGYPSSHIRK